MLIKFFPHGKQQPKKPRESIRKAIDYLTASQVWDRNQKAYVARSIAPVVASGNPDDLYESVAYGNHIGRYTSGVLRFTEQISKDFQQKAIEGFQNALLPGLDPSQYHALWVRHEDKGGVELHFLIGGEELTTGKRLNAYYAKVDQSRVNHWKNFFNARYGLSDPNDPLRQQTTRLTKNLPQDKKSLIIELDDRISIKVENGEIHNRKDITNYLKELKLEVSRETKSSISIKDPNGGKQNIRLKGAFYEESFSSKIYERKQVRERVIKYRDNRQKRAITAFDSFKSQYRKRSESNRKKYKVNLTEKNLLPNYGDHYDSSHRNWDRFVFKPVPRKQNDSEHLPKEQKPSRMQGNSNDREQHESMPTTIEGEEYGEAIGTRNNRFYEQFWKRLYETRRRLEESLRRLTESYKNLRRKPVRSLEELRQDGRELQANGVGIQQSIRDLQGMDNPSKRLGKKVRQVDRKIRDAHYPRFRYPDPS